jgi:hypothetical protein
MVSRCRVGIVFYHCALLYAAAADTACSRAYITVQSLNLHGQCKQYYNCKSIFETRSSSVYATQSSNICALLSTRPYIQTIYPSYSKATSYLYTCMQPSSPSTHSIYESQIGPYALTPFFSRPPTTHFTTPSLLSTNTASTRSSRPTRKHTSSKSGRPS